MADVEFTRSARRPAPVVEDALIQWATGLPTVNRQIYAGWMVEAGKQDDLDGAMQSAGFSKVTIKHGDIPSIEMPPMTMVFGVKDSAWLETAKAGDKIRFDAVLEGGKYIVTRLEADR